MVNKEVERRQFVRLVKSIPVGLSIPERPGRKAPISREYEFIGCNIGEGGIFLEATLSEERLFSNLSMKQCRVNLKVHLVEWDTILELTAEVVWIRKPKDVLENRPGFGMKFVEITPERRNSLSSYISEMLKQPRSFKDLKAVVIEPKAPDYLPRFSLFIDGEDMDTGVYEYFPYADKAIVDPRVTRKMIQQLKRGQSPEGYQDYIFARYCINKEDTNQKAIQAAYRASQIFKYFPLERRRKILGDIHDLLVAHRDRIIELLVIEGHPVQLAQWELSGMVKGVAKETLDFYGSEFWKEVGREGEEVLYLTRKADGVVCLSPPRNASCSNSFTAVLVFLAGNTLVVKPPLRTPLSTIYLWRNVVQEALKRNGAPNGTLNIVVGNSKKIMDEWLSSPYVDDIIYFGDSATGLEIGTRAFQAGKKPILELSGNDMFLVWKDASIDMAIFSLLDSFLGSTQICMVPKKAIIHQDVYEEFVESFLREVRRLKVGLPSDPQTRLSPVVKIKEFFGFLEDALQNGAEILYGGERLNYKGLPDEKGIYIRPTILHIGDEYKAMKMRCIKEENFFPLLPLVRITGDSDEAIFDRMIDMVNSNDYGLRISVWVNSDYYIQKFMERAQNSGLLRINLRHVGFSLYLATHGGTGKTGGPYGEMNYMWQKTSHQQGVSRRRIQSHPKRYSGESRV